MSSSSDGSELCKETTWSSSDSPSDDEFFIPTHVYEEASSYDKHSTKVAKPECEDLPLDSPEPTVPPPLPKTSY